MRLRFFKDRDNFVIIRDEPWMARQLRIWHLEDDLGLPRSSSWHTDALDLPPKCNFIGCHDRHTANIQHR
jgi:hypothetical protein